MMRDSYYRYQNGSKALRLAVFFLKNRKWVSENDIQYAEGVIRRFKALLKKARDEEEQRRSTIKKQGVSTPSTITQNQVLMTIINELANRLFTVCAIHMEFPYI